MQYVQKELKRAKLRKRTNVTDCIESEKWGQLCAQLVTHHCSHELNYQLCRKKIRQIKELH